MVHLAKAQGGSRILQMSSVGGQVAVPGMSLYHTSKWAIEGFFEATTQEVALYNIQTTMIEPVGARTSIFDAGRLVHGPELAAYAGTPARQTNRPKNF